MADAKSFLYNAFLLLLSQFLTLIIPMYIVFTSTILFCSTHSKGYTLIFYFLFRIMQKRSEASMKKTEQSIQRCVTTRLCHFIKNESPRNAVFISISGRFALK